MPGKNELRAMLLATLQAPLQNFVALLAAPAQNLVYLLAAKERKTQRRASRKASRAQSTQYQLHDFDLTDTVRRISKMA